MPCRHREVEILLTKLENSLREATLWSSFAPSAKAFQSKLPFALDTMTFEQWMQFVFIPKMSEIVSTKSALPDNIKLLPMAEQSPNISNNQLGVVEVIKQIDLAFSVS